MTDEDSEIIRAAGAAYESEVGERLKGRLLTAGVLHRITDNDDLLAAQVPTRGVIEAAVREFEEMPPDEAAFYRERAEEVTMAYMREAARRVWRAGEQLRLEQLDRLPANVVAMVAATLAVRR